MPENSIEGIFKAIEKLRVLIIGDSMIDEYSYGSVDRISPEAPVPIVRVKNTEQRLGGAANTALNIKSMGATPFLCSVIGKDRNGNQLLRLLKSEGLSAQGIVQSEERVTTVKHRIISGSQHLIRIDSEDDHPLGPNQKKALIAQVLTLLDNVDAIIFQDYDKGVLDSEFIAEVIRKAKEKGVPTIVDPKERNFFNYQGCSLFKPNLSELSKGLGRSVAIEKESLDEDLVELAKTGAANHLVTLSKKGIYWNDSVSSGVFPAHERAIADISGAGDTVVSLAALTFALKLPLCFVAEFANLGGGIVCESQGVVPINQGRLLEEALKSSLLKQQLEN